MTDRMEIRGGVGPFEAAAVVAVVNHVLAAEREKRSRRPNDAPRPTAWVRAALPRNPQDPLAAVFPDHRGDPL